MKPNDKFPPPPSAAQPATLATALNNAAGDLRQILPPPELRARVLAAAQAAAAARADARPAATAGSGGRWQRLLAAIAAPSGGPSGKGGWAWSGVAACVVVLAGSALLMLRVPAPGPTDEAARLAGAGGGFLPLVPPEHWPREAAPAWLVSTELPGERLAALGLPYDPAHAGDSVRAELLLHPSGEVLAVRFLH